MRELLRKQIFDIGFVENSSDGAVAQKWATARLFCTVRRCCQEVHQLLLYSKTKHFLKDSFMENVGKILVSQKRVTNNPVNYFDAARSVFLAKFMQKCLKWHICNLLIIRFESQLDSDNQ